MDDNLHSPQRLLIELRMEHADLNDVIDRINLPVTTSLTTASTATGMAVHAMPVDDLALRRLKRRRLLLRDQIACLEMTLQPPEPA